MSIGGSAEVFFDPDKLNTFDLLGELVRENKFVGIVTNFPRRRKVPFEVIDLFADDDRTIRVFVKDTDLNIVDLTGAICVFSVKETKEDTSFVFQKSSAVPAEGMIGAADEGEVFFFIVPADTVSLGIRQYVWDVRVELSNGKTYTVLTGTLNLLQPVNI